MLAANILTRLRGYAVWSGSFLFVKAKLCLCSCLGSFDIKENGYTFMGGNASKIVFSPF